MLGTTYRQIKGGVMSKVRLTGYIVIPENERCAVLDALKIHQALTKNEVGCLRFELSSDDNDACKFWLIEEFVDETAFLLHQERTRQSPWYQASINVARRYQPLVYLDE